MMADVELTSGVAGDKAVATLFQTTGQRAMDLTKPFKRVRETLLKTFDMNVSGPSKMPSESWKPRAGRSSWSTPEPTGKMGNSFEGEAGSDYVAFYTTQRDRAGGELSQQRVMGLDDGQLEDIVEEIKAYIMGAE